MSIIIDGKSLRDHIKHLRRQTFLLNKKVKNLSSPSTGTSSSLMAAPTSLGANIAISSIPHKDEDDMASNSVAHLATQQSIKAYVDTNFFENGDVSGHYYLTNPNDTGSINFRIKDNSSNTLLPLLLDYTGFDVRTTLTVGVDDTGHDVKFFGATSGKYMLWDESADSLKLTDTTNLDAGTGLRLYTDANGHAVIYALGQDKDLYLVGDDGGTGINALVFDMSDHGKASFNGQVNIGNPGYTSSNPDGYMKGAGNNGTAGSRFQVTANSSDNTRRLWLGTSHTEAAITITENKVGIGTTTLIPAATLLHLFDSAPELRIQDGGDKASNASGYLSFYDHDSLMMNFGVNDGGAAELNLVNNAAFTFKTNNSVALTLNASQNATFAGHIILPDSKELRFGTGTDANIRHDGNNTKFSHTGSGGLYIGADTIGLQSGDHGTNFLTLTSSGATFAGNIALGGGALKTYHSNVTSVIALDDNSSLFTRADETYLAQNFYYNSSDIGAAIEAGYSTVLRLTEGAFYIYGTAASVSADATTSLQERFKIDTSGDAAFTGNIRTGTSTLTANTNFDNLVIEGSAHTGITIFSGASSDGGIYFGDSDANNLGQIKYLHGSNAMTFATSDGAASLTLDSGLNATFTGTVALAGSNAAEKKLTINNSTANGIQFNYDNSNNYRNQILNYWNSNTDSRMDFNIARTSGQTPETILSVGYGGRVGINTATPACGLDIEGGDNTGAKIRITNTNATDNSWSIYANYNTQDLIFLADSTEVFRLKEVGTAATFAGTVSHAGLDIADGTGAQIDTKETFDLNLDFVANTWIDTGIYSNSGSYQLGSSGTYIMQIYSNDHSPNEPYWYSMYWSAIISWYKGTGNQAVSYPITLQRAGHSDNNRVLEAQITNTTSSGSPANELRLELKTTSTASSTDISIRFRRLL